ncbi:MAG: hypothetical protein R2828_24305 [Saprospiraceae bacterium]
MNDTPSDPDILRLLRNGEFKAARNLLHQVYFSHWCQAILQLFPFIRENEVYTAWLKVFSVFKKQIKELGLLITDTTIKGLEDSLPVHLLNMVKQHIEERFKKVTRESEDFRVIYAIQKGLDQHMRAIYHHFRDYFFGFASKNFPNCTNETIEDIFQDTLIVLIEYVKQEKIRLLETEEGILIIGLNAKATIKTMIIAIGKRMLARNCSKSKETPLDPADFFGQDFDSVVEEWENDREEMVQAILKIIVQLKTTDKQLLFYKYWLELSSEDIREIIKADTAGAVRTRLTRLRDKIKKLI